MQHKEAKLSARYPIIVCPFAYFSCKLPAGESCPISKRITGEETLPKYLNITDRAVKCPHREKWFQTG